MTIKKFIGSTKEEAIALAKEELGESIVVMNSKDKKPEGVFGIFKKSIVEVTVALEDQPEVIPFPAAPTRVVPTASTFSVVADEKISLDNTVSEEELKSTFKEINEVLEKGNRLSVETKVPAEKTIIKKQEIEEEKIKEEIIEPEPDKKETKISDIRKRQGVNLSFVKMLYKMLLDNEVDEKYINQILDDMGNILSSPNSIDYLISNVYQKMVLKLGQPNVINVGDNTPKVVFFIGPTGVGKTTTIAKVASSYKIKKKKKVAFITADTYRIAATEQLNTYADILDVPISVLYKTSEINDEIKRHSDCDLIFVDTLGFSHKNEEQKSYVKELIDSVDERFEKQVFLVLSVTTKYKDLKSIVDVYNDICDYSLIFTKLDETDAYGSILNIRMYSGAPVSYITNGQDVPNDIEIIDSQKIVKQYLGG